MKHIESKAVTLVLDKRVTVSWVSPSGDAASGKVDGYTDTYQVSYSPEEKICTCPAGAHHRACSHSLALELEVTRQREEVAV